MSLRQRGHCINSLVSRPIRLSLNFSSQFGHKATKSNIGFPFFKIQKSLLFDFFLDLVFYERHECGFHAVWIDKHGMGSVLCSQKDGAGINALNSEDYSIFYAFEHVTCFYHGISFLGNSEGSERLTYLLPPSAPPDKPPILPKSMRGRAPPET